MTAADLRSEKPNKRADGLFFFPFRKIHGNVENMATRANLADASKWAESAITITAFRFGVTIDMTGSSIPPDCNDTD